MQPQIIENRVNEIIELVAAGKPVEDFRYELKRDWHPDPHKAARILAGQANAACPETIFWVMGVDDKTGAVHPLSAVNLANWYPQVCGWFEDGFAPELIRDMTVPTPKGRVHVLAFETDRAPYVVNRPSGGGHEVPWRKGTSTCTAGRAELLRLLVPKISLPKFDVLEGVLRGGPSKMANEERDPIHVWMVEAGIYLVPTRNEVLHAQHRKITGWITREDGSEFCKLDAFDFDGQPREYIQADAAQFVVQSAGVLKIKASGKRDTLTSFLDKLVVHLWFEFVEIDGRQLEVSFPVHKVEERPASVHSMSHRKVQEIVRYEKPR